MRLAVAMAFVLVSSCDAPDGQDLAPPPSDAVRELSIAPALIESGRVSLGRSEVRPVAVEHTIVGHVVARVDGEAYLGAAVGARVRTINVDEGETVEIGQALATLDAPEVARLHGELAQAAARRHEAERILEQEESLFLKKATSERARLAAQAELAQAKAQQASIAAQLSAVGGQADVIRSPIAGRVAHRSVSIGAFVEPGQPLFQVIDEAALEVVADTPLHVAVHAKRGDSVELTLLHGEATCSGAIVERALTVDHQTHRVPLRIRPDKGCQGLVHGSFAEASFSTVVADETAVAVVRDAVVDLDGQTHVFVEHGGAFLPRRVVVTRYGRDWAYLGEGLKAGETVVVRGALLLKGEWMRGALE